MGETQVSGETAANFKVIKLDDLCDAFQGELVAADSMAGTFSWKDKTGAIKQENLGAPAIRIVPKR